MNSHHTSKRSTQPSARIAMGAWLFGFIGMGVLSLLCRESILVTVIIGAMGGTCTLVLAYPDASYAHAPILSGQLFSTIIGWLFIHHFGAYWTAPMIFVGTVLSCVTVFSAYRTLGDTHPMQTRIRQHTCWGFLFFPNIFSTIAVIVYATHLNNVQDSFPQQKSTS